MAMKITQSIKATLLASSLVVTGLAAQAGTEAIIDCPLRDVSYSVELPLMEILLKPEATAVVNRNMGGILDKLPPQFASKTAPSLSAILKLTSIAAMSGIPEQALEKVDAELRALSVNDTDRRARCARYDNEVPSFDLPKDKTHVLVFHKINGFDHGPSVSAATHAIQSLGEQMGWTVAVTDKGGAMNPKTLAQFDAVIWNNNSGDVLTFSQRKAFEDYINKGGGYLGIHGAGGDFLYLWDWYADTLLGARFIGHPSDPQFQNAEILLEENTSGIGSSLKPGWTMKGEWYSFRESPRKSGAAVIATLDESTYLPEGRGGQNLRMGDDHPIVWQRCVGKGRAFYTAIGHRPEAYHIPENLTLLREAMYWTAGKGASYCKKGKELSR